MVVITATLGLAEWVKYAMVTMATYLYYYVQKALQSAHFEHVSGLVEQICFE